MYYYCASNNNGSNLAITSNYQRTANVDYIATYLEGWRKQTGYKLTNQAIAAICTAALSFGINPTKFSNGTQTTLGAFNQPRAEVIGVTGLVNPSGFIKWLDYELFLLQKDILNNRRWYGSQSNYGSWADFMRGRDSVVAMARAFRSSYMSLGTDATTLSILSILAANVWGYLYGGATGGVGGEDGGGGGGGTSGGGVTGNEGEGDEGEDDHEGELDPAEVFKDWLLNQIIIPYMGGVVGGNGFGYGRRKSRSYLRGDIT